MKLEELKQYLFNIVDRKIHALYYKVPHTGFTNTVKLRNNYDMHVMFDISAAQGKLEIYIDHVGVDFIIAMYICPNVKLAKMMSHVITDYTSDCEDSKKEITQTDYTFDHMVEWAEQHHLENQEAKQVECHKVIWRNRIILWQLREQLEADVALVNNFLDMLTRYLEQMRSGGPEMLRVESLPDDPLIKYDFNILERSTLADMSNSSNLVAARNQLL
ncbi:hypothetical protein Tco_0148844 [Tanacetum coccineum]